MLLPGVIRVKTRTNEQVFLDKFSFSFRVYAKKWQFFLDKEPGIRATRANFSTRKTARAYVQQETLEREIVCLCT